MGTTASKPVGTGAEAPKIHQGLPPQKEQPPAPAACPLGFDKLAASEQDDAPSQPSSSSAASTPTCPVTTPKEINGSAAPAPGSGSVAAGGGGGGGGSGAPDSASSCPVKGEAREKAAKYLHPHKYNVYSQRLDNTPNSSSSAKGVGGAAGGGVDGRGFDPTNNMPANPNQQPAPGQQHPLSTERVPSTIPKGGEETTWTYPSPQMFWNALTRKGKVEDTQETDMDVVVSIHNNMNEFTWKKILQWEKIRSRGAAGEEGKEGSEPRLLRFLGRPDDVTPKALGKMMLGHPLPFDRHDWVVDRGGDERRYIIDYYHDEGGVDGDAPPELHSEDVVQSIKVDVRPALDGFRDFADRLVQMPLARLTGKSDFLPLPFRPSPTMTAREPRAKPRAKQGLPAESTATPRGRQTPVQGGEVAGAGEKAPLVLGEGGNQVARKKLSIAERDARAVARMKKKCVKPLRALQAAEEEASAAAAAAAAAAASEDNAMGSGSAAAAAAAAEAAAAEASAGAAAAAAALRLEYCTARFLCKKEARAYKETVAFADATAKGVAGGGVGGGGQAYYWTEMALDRRLAEMRSALARFTERQMEAAHREHAGDAGEGGGGSPTV